MKFIFLQLLVALSMLLCNSSVFGQLKLPAIFSDNMVLQRDKPVNIWGKATVGSTVTVSFALQKVATITQNDGTWKLALAPMPMSVVPQNLTIQSDVVMVFKNILVGDVWLCSGQSNMEYPLNRKLKKYAAPLKGVDDAEKELTNTNRPDNVRYIYVERLLNKFPALPTKGWVNGTDTIVNYVSAIGYFFAKEIYETTNVPIGIISSSWGGTRVEEWTPSNIYEQSPVFKDSTTKPDFKIDGMRPGQKWKGMIEPLIPFTVKGVLWYQGESNCMIEDQETYPEKFRLMQQSWNNSFSDVLPFYTVQIAPYNYSARKDPKKHSTELLAQFWEAQSKCTKLLNTEMVVTTDLVDKLSDIHPSYKWIIGHRLALVALAKTYGKNELVYSGPVFASAKKNKKQIVLQFNHTGSGLASSDQKPLTWFTIAGKDKKFVPATVRIEGNKLIVQSPDIKKPKYVRFAWHETAMPNFINKEGLPAQPFRTDKLKIK